MASLPSPPSVSVQSVTPAGQIQFEQELHVAEYYLTSKEIELKLVESKRSRWTNPLVVAVFGALIVAGVNVIVSHRKNVNEQRISQDRADGEAAGRQNAKDMEVIRAENANILEVVKLEDQEKVRNELCMMMELNAIQTPETFKA